MDERVGFTSSEIRVNFFNEAKSIIGVESWEQFYKQFRVARSMFQKYRYGKSLLPKILFNRLIELMPDEKRQFFSNTVFIKQGNWGIVKGGKENYRINSKKIIKQLRKGFHKYIKSENFRVEELSRVNIDMSLTEDLCEFIGLIIGGGCIDGYANKSGKSYNHFSITGDSELDINYLTNKVPSIMQNIFGMQPKVTFRKDSQAIVLKFYSKQIFDLLTKRFGFIAGNKTYCVTIPTEILNAGEKYVFATIRGIFDTDGSVYLDKRRVYAKPYPRIVLSTTSKPLFLQLKSLLNKHFSLYVLEMAASSSKNEAPKYYLVIYGRRQMKKWRELIGFSNEQHLKKIRELESSGWESNPQPAVYKTAALPLCYQSNPFMS